MPSEVIRSSLAVVYYHEEMQTLYIRWRGEVPFTLSLTESQVTRFGALLGWLVSAAEQESGPARKRVCRDWPTPAAGKTAVEDMREASS